MMNKSISKSKNNKRIKINTLVSDFSFKNKKGQKKSPRKIVSL